MASTLLVIKAAFDDEACVWFVGSGDDPSAPKPFTAPVTINSRHTANKILRDAGLDKAF